MTPNDVCKKHESYSTVSNNKNNLLPHKGSYHVVKATVCISLAKHKEMHFVVENEDFALRCSRVCSRTHQSKKAC